MNTEKFLEKINDQAKAYYSSTIDSSIEEGKNLNWLLGLAGGALIFSFNKYDQIDPSEAPLILIQEIIFILIISVGYIHRVAIKKFKDDTLSIMRMLDFLKLEFNLVPDEIEDDLENGYFDQIYSDYMDGEYFIEESSDRFEQLMHFRNKNYKRYNVLTVISILLIIIQFGCFFISILF